MWKRRRTGTNYYVRLSGSTSSDDWVFSLWAATYVYGHRVRGPLAILSESWQSSNWSADSVLSHILSIHNKLETMKGLASWYQFEKCPKQAEEMVWQEFQSREFRCGDLVLLLLPTSTNKLLAKWQGSYKVIKRIGRVNYLIEMPDCRKKRNINMLRKWESAGAMCGLAKEEKFPDWKSSKVAQPTLWSQLLSVAEKEELWGVLKEFDDVLQGIQDKPL